jgi:hypothetical protein
MTTGYYTSDTPVSRRVDAAWGKGYEQGLRDGRRCSWRLIAGAGAIFLVLTYGRRLARMGLVFLPWAIVLMVVALPPALLFGAVFATTQTVKRHHHKQIERPRVVTLDDGSTF